MSVLLTIHAKEKDLYKYIYMYSTGHWPRG